MELKRSMYKKKENIKLIVNSNCQLRILTKKDVSDDYIFWINDFDVTKYTEQRFRSHTKLDVENFVDEKFNSESDYLFGIYLDEKHIGNIKLGSIKWDHMIGTVSYFIGDKSFWGKGIASAAIKRVIKFALSDLKLKKINAGYYENNISSAKVLEKCGFFIEGVKRSDIIFDGERINLILVGFTEEDANR